MLAVSHAGVRERNGNGALGPCEGNIEKPPFLFHFLRGDHPAAGREKVFLHTGYENIRELQALCSMNRHESHFVGRFFIRHIHIGKERDILEVIGKGDFGKV